MALEAALFLAGTLTILNHCHSSLIQTVNVLLEYALLAIKVVYLLDSYLDLQIGLIQLWEHNLCNYTSYMITGAFSTFSERCIAFKVDCIIPVSATLSLLMQNSRSIQSLWYFWFQKYKVKINCSFA